MICEKCNGKMIHRFSFSPKGDYEWYQCPRCGFETIKVPVFTNSQIKQNNGNCNNKEKE